MLVAKEKELVAEYYDPLYEQKWLLSLLRSRRLLWASIKPVCSRCGEPMVSVYGGWVCRKCGSRVSRELTPSVEELAYKAAEMAWASR